ncbi:hypothetical protein NECAME_04066 [Necator americanus]|uniref:C2H2-type domain-containing protein n=1 Tax=Necator americanus TaxID=51031 RepID=W2T096_NECAM|nr:hypothetical protein NECAME_04066 [Necator americanus]ETN74387.1 hypothetical protein NECAME_04066 [Necator americanus]
MEFRSIFSPSTSRDANIRRKRTAPLKSSRHDVLESESVHCVAAGHFLSRPTRISCWADEAANAYVSEVARKYTARMRRIKERSEEPSFQSESSSLAQIEQRLSCLVGECDVSRMTCCVPMCGRVFHSVPVLAWHMSYSHHDLAVSSAYGTLCFVCGVRMDSVKGKVIHLVSKHKDLCSSHNEQCLHQRLPVISPLAPAAMRLAQYSGGEEEDDESNTYEEVAFDDFSANSSIAVELSGEKVGYD